jgi:glycosyltransferase involved in cell wall biosynthesis
MQSTLIVVPCYEEEQRLQPQAFIDALAAERELSFLFVDDGSRDGTREILDELCRQAPGRLRAISLPANRGKAEAVRRGFLAGIECGGFELIGYWDADLATPLHEVPRMAALLDDLSVQIVMGSRVGLLGRKIERKRLRHYLGRAFATTASLVLDISVYDTQCGAKLFRVTDALVRVFERPFSTAWIFDVEILSRCKALEVEGRFPPLQGSVVEYPLLEWRDIAGSKLRLGHALRAAWELGRLAVERAATGRPPPA